MSVSVYLRKQPSAFVPDDAAGAEYMRGIKIGDVLRAEITKPRNGKFHRKFFKLLEVAFENQDKYDVFEAFRAEVTMRSGFFIEHHHVTGAISYQPKSIAFGKMDELEFSKLYNKAIDVIIKNFMPGTDADELNQAVNEIVGFM